MKSFQELHQIEEVERFIKEEPFFFLYIFTPDCSVCHGLLPKVEQVVEKYPLIVSRKVNAQKVGEVASNLSVFSVPTLLLFVYGKEYVREGRFVSIEGLNEKISKIYSLAVNEPKE